MTERQIESALQLLNFFAQGVCWHNGVCESYPLQIGG